MRRWIASALLIAGFAVPIAAQGYRLRLDTQFQSVTFRGVQLDSLARAEIVEQPNAGPTTPDGIPVQCGAGSQYCFYYRAGPNLRGQPLTTTANLTLWGFGGRGLTAHVTGRLATDLGQVADWPGTKPRSLLTEGYLEFARPQVTARLGRQLTSGRLGWQGFDGASLEWRGLSGGVSIHGYGGWGLARGIALPVTSPVLNPLDEFQPRDRQLVAGADFGFRHQLGELRAEYRREVDPAVDYFVSERAAFATEIRPMRRLRVAGGADYDFAHGWWGSAEGSVTLSGARGYVAAELRRYRPYFDLWTIWGAFSPIPYHAYRGVVAAEPVKGLWIRGHAERYWFGEAETETPLTTVEDRGWRTGLFATASPSSRWQLSLSLQRDFGPGASSQSFDAGVSFAARERLTAAIHGGRLDRPLEFRYSDARLHWISASGDLRLSREFRLTTALGWYGDRRSRPDPSGFDQGQLRLSTRLVLDLGNRADRLPKAVLPPASRTP